MRDTDLLQTALGLAAPWVMSGSRFDAVARRLDIDIMGSPADLFKTAR
jgi:hypothetical protein